ncbi:MAG: O-antigen ligase family protein [Lysobacterales bacterium]
MLKLRWPRLSRAQLLRRAALAYLIVWVLSPPLGYGAIWRVLAVLAMLLWLALEALATRGVLLRPSWWVLGAVVFVLYTAFIEWLVPDSSAVNRQFSIWIMLFFLLVGESFRRGRDDDARFCFWLILLVLPIWMFTTLRGLETIGADVSRAISRTSDEAKQLTEEGIGGFGFVYTVLLFVPFLAHLTLWARGRLVGLTGKWQKRLGYGLIAANCLLALALLLRAGYSIALLLTAFALAFVFLIRSRRLLPFAMSLCLSGLLVLVGGLALGPIFDILQGVASGTEYSTKVRDVQASLEGGQSTGTLAMRVDRYQRSARLFMENPVLGTLTFNDVGKHSAILDRFAQYGFAFGLLFLLLITYIPLAMLRDRRVPIGLALAFLTIAITHPMTNNVFMSWGLVLYVFSYGTLAVMGIPLERRCRARVDEGVIAHA